MEAVIVSAAELRRRTVTFASLEADGEAFVDTRVPGSTPKFNFGVIGPGVAQGAASRTRLTEPHGFNLGAAAMPHGVTNNLHLHFTAEVFTVFRGSWTFRWGPRGEQGEVVAGEGDVVSVPTWIFRGFTNSGPDDGFLFTLLGQESTGGIVWNPSVLEAARRTGLALDRSNRIVDLAQRDLPPEERLPEISEAQIAQLRRFTPQEMEHRIVRAADLRWSPFPFIDNALPGGDKQLAPVIGYGLCEDGNAEPPLPQPHSFKMEWLRAQPGNGLHLHRHIDSQVLLVKRGTWEAAVNRGGARMTVRLGPGDLVSVPSGAWRSIQCLEGDPGLLMLVTGGDGRTRIEWDAAVLEAARQRGWQHDPDGRVGSAEVLALST